MSDFAARGLAVQSRSIARRLSTLDALARGISHNLPQGMPGIMGTPIAESGGTRTAATQIASGTTYQVSSSTPSIHMKHHFGLYGADWPFNNSFSIAGINVHLGNGSNPAAAPFGQPGGVVRFQTHSDKFELIVYNAYGFRVKVNGKYAKAGMYGCAALNGDTNNALRYFLFDFAGTEFAGTGLKLIEIQADALMYFTGARVPLAHTITPWPQAIPLKAALHGDSMMVTIVDSGTDYRTAQHGGVAQHIQTFTGISDVWNNSIGGIGFNADSGGTKSDFIEQAAVDFSGEKFDLIWEAGGRNDAAVYGSENAYRDRVKAWLDLVLEDNPDTIVFMTGPVSVANSEGYASSATFAAMQRAKKAACALYPRNCAFIETIGNAVTADPWIFGTGRVGATTSNGNADFVVGSDAVHPSTYGASYLATRLVAETTRVLPNLHARIRNGVIPGVNDLDLM